MMVIIKQQIMEVVRIIIIIAFLHMKTHLTMQKFDKIK